jgi:SAM-dependent methyltransferase
LNPAGCGSVDHWSRYWRAGHLHSCPGAFPGNYGDVIGETWRAYFAGLRRGSRVLDVGTGNGAVAFLAREVSRSRELALGILAIDAADIDPALAARALGIDPSEVRFAGRSRIEDTGLEDGSIDAVSSQFAIEYADVPAAACELARIVRPHGTLLIVAHHAQSDAVRVAREDRSRLDDPDGPLPLARRARDILALARGAASGAELQRRFESVPLRQAVGALNDVARTVRQRAVASKEAAWLGGVAVQVATALQEIGLMQFDAASARLDALEQAMSEHRARLEDILRVALDAQGVEVFRASFREAEFEVDSASPLRLANGDLIGWRIGARRRGAASA